MIVPIGFKVHLESGTSVKCNNLFFGKLSTIPKNVIISITFQVILERVDVKHCLEWRLYTFLCLHIFLINMLHISLLTFTFEPQR